VGSREVWRLAAINVWGHAQLIERYSAGGSSARDKQETETTDRVVPACFDRHTLTGCIYLVLK